MRRFSALYDAIDRTTSTNAKVEALAAYFRDAPPADAAWATFFLTGRRLRRVVASAALREWAQELTQLPPWLFGECYAAAGDFAEIPERTARRSRSARCGQQCPRISLGDEVRQSPRGERAHVNRQGPLQQPPLVRRIRDRCRERHVGEH